MILKQEQKNLPTIFSGRVVLGLLPTWVGEGNAILGALFTLDFLLYMKGTLLTGVGILPSLDTSMLFPNIWKIAIRNGASKSFNFLALFPNCDYIILTPPGGGQQVLAGWSLLESCFYSSTFFWYTSPGILIEC